MGFRMDWGRGIFITAAGSQALLLSEKMCSGDSSALEWCQECRAQHVTAGGICTGMLAKGSSEALIPQANPHAAQHRVHKCPPNPQPFSILAHISAVPGAGSAAARPQHGTALQIPLPSSLTSSARRWAQRSWEAESFPYTFLQDS